MIDFTSITKVRKFCLSIIDPEKEEPFVFKPRPLTMMEADFPGPAFAAQRRTVREGSRPGVSFPLLLCWKMEELVQTNCPDTFIEPKIVRLKSEAELAGISAPSEESPKLDFLQALQSDEELHRYMDGSCALCGASGAAVRLQRCARCHVAKYCGKEHQTEDWKEHKKHCKRLQVLRHGT